MHKRMHKVLALNACECQASSLWSVSGGVKCVRLHILSRSLTSSMATRHLLIMRALPFEFLSFAVGHVVIKSVHVKIAGAVRSTCIPSYMT